MATRPDPDLRQALLPLRRRALAVDLVDAMARALAPAAAWVLLVGTGWRWAGPAATPAVALAGAGVLVGLAALWVALRPRTDVALAHRGDRAAGLAERLVTAVAPAEPESPLGQLQRADALRAAAAAEWRRHLPVRLPARSLAVALAAALAAAWVWLWPGGAPDRARELEQLALLRAAAGAEAKKLDALDPEEGLAPLAATLDQLQKDLTAARDPRSALAMLTAAEARLAAGAGPDARAAADVLADLRAALAGSAADGLADAIGRRDWAEVQRELNRLGGDLAQMTEQDRERLAGALEQAARQALRSGARTVDQALARAAEAARAGQVPDSGPFAAAAAALAQLGREARPADAADAVRDALALARDQVAVLGSGEGPTGADVVRVNPPEGVSGGGSRSTREAPPGDRAAGGAGASTGGSAATGGTAGQPPGQPRGPAPEKVRTFGADTGAPPGAAGAVTGVGGQAGAGPGTPVGLPRGPAAGGALRPYTEVLADYSRQAREGMERAGLPPQVRDLVREYFATLAQDGNGGR